MIELNKLTKEQTGDIINILEYFLYEFYDAVTDYYDN